MRHGVHVIDNSDGLPVDETYWSDDSGQALTRDTAATTVAWINLHGGRAVVRGVAD